MEFSIWYYAKIKIFSNGDHSWHLMSMKWNHEKNITWFLIMITIRGYKQHDLTNLSNNLTEWLYALELLLNINM